MRKKLILLCLSGIILCSGCGGAKEESTPAVEGDTEKGTVVATERTEEALATEKVQATDTAETEAEPEATDEMSYFDTWKITACAGTSQVYAMSDEEIEQVIGHEFTYDADSFSNTWKNVTIEVEGYEEVEYPAESFAVDYNVSAEALGITSDTVVFVSAMTDGGNAGDYFVVVDENTILLNWDGVFFRAERQ